MDAVKTKVEQSKGSQPPSHLHAPSAKHAPCPLQQPRAVSAVGENVGAGDGAIVGLGVLLVDGSKTRSIDFDSGSLGAWDHAMLSSLGFNWGGNVGLATDESGQRNATW